MAEVDLTEDKSYSNLMSLPRNKDVLFRTFHEVDTPWNFNTPYTLPQIAHSDKDLETPPLIFTGDAETVNFMREVVEVEEGIRCDCCGRLITTPLWDMPVGGLCSECEQRLDETVYGKFDAPWQRAEQQKAERLVPWWYDI